MVLMLGDARAKNRESHMPFLKGVERDAIIQNIKLKRREDSVPKYEKETGFVAEYEKLTPQQKKQFRTAVKKIIAALDAGNFPGPPLVIKMSGFSLYEVRWAADGRATFEYRYDTKLNEQIVVWRRIGDHSVLNHP